MKGLKRKKKEGNKTQAAVEEKMDAQTVETK